MTAAQRSYLETLCRETGEEFDDTLSKAEASKRIDELRALASPGAGIVPRKLQREIGRGDWIRTSDPLRPRQVRYQAALRPDLTEISILLCLPRRNDDCRAGRQACRLSRT